MWSFKLTQQTDGRVIVKQMKLKETNLKEEQLKQDVRSKTFWASLHAISSFMTSKVHVNFLQTKNQNYGEKNKIIRNKSKNSNPIM